MVARIMVRAAGGARPLSFDSNAADPASRARGSLGLVSSATPWAGLPIEAHRICTCAEPRRSRPCRRQCGLLVVAEGKLEIAARRGGRELRSVVESGCGALRVRRRTRDPRTDDGKRQRGRRATAVRVVSAPLARRGASRVRPEPADHGGPGRSCRWSWPCETRWLEARRPGASTPTRCRSPFSVTWCNSASRAASTVFLQLAGTSRTSSAIA